MNSARVSGCFELFICLVSRQGSVDDPYKCNCLWGHLDSVEGCLYGVLISDELVSNQFRVQTFVGKSENSPILENKIGYTRIRMNTIRPSPDLAR